MNHEWDQTQRCIYWQELAKHLWWRYVAKVFKRLKAIKYLQYLRQTLFYSSRSSMFFKIGVYKKFYIQRKIPVQEYLFNKVQTGRLPALLKSNSNTGVFCEYRETFKNGFLYSIFSGYFYLLKILLPKIGP